MIGGIYSAMLGQASMGMSEYERQIREQMNYMQRIQGGTVGPIESGQRANEPKNDDNILLIIEEGE